MLDRGTRILVTGSSRGIGAAIACRAGVHGARLIVNYRTDAEAAVATADLVRSAGGEAIIIQADVRDRQQIATMLEQVEQEFGGLDALVNNAHTPFEPTAFDALSWEAVDEQIRGSVRSCFECTQAALPLLRSSPASSILNISSITTRQPVRRFTHRNLAKAAVEGFTRSLAVELSTSGVRVNALAVGWTCTDQLAAMPEGMAAEALSRIPMARLATREEIADTALFLVSPAASYITGMVMPVSGGLEPDPKWGN